MNIKGLMIVSLSFLVFFGCEADDETGTLIGSWSILTLGDYANATDCSGAIDNSEWDAFMDLGMSMTLNINSNASCTMEIGMPLGSGLPDQTLGYTWVAIDGEFCRTGTSPENDGEITCGTYTLDGSSLTMTEQEAGYCEDATGTEVTTILTETECIGMTGHTWEDASCSVSTWFKAGSGA